MVGGFYLFWDGGEFFFYLFCDGGEDFYHGPDVSRAMVITPPIQDLTDHFIEQTRTNMSQPGRRPGTVAGDEWHVLQALWSRKDI